MESQVKLISYVNLRQSIGWLGILLPVTMIFESTIYCNESIRNSISHYYYSNLGDVFVAILTALSVFLFSYKGYEKEKDNLITNITAFAALGVAFFPTDGVEMMCLGNCSSKIPADIYHNLHLFSASVFFLTLAILLIFYFTKTDETAIISLEKKKRNIIYKTCGVIMLICFMWVIINRFIDVESIFWPETIALFSFGFAWLTKGELFLKDKN